MVRIINSFRDNSNLGQTIQALGQQIFGDTLTPAVNREKLRGETITNDARVATADAIRGFGTPEFTPQNLLAQGLLADRKGGDLANFLLALNANVNGATAPGTTDAFVGAGGAFANTAPGQGRTIAGQDRRNAATIAGADARNTANIASRERIAAAKPTIAIDATGNPVFTTAGEAPGQAAPIPNTQRALKSRFDEAFNLAKVQGFGDKEATAFAFQQISKGSKGVSVKQGPDGGFEINVGGTPSTDLTTSTRSNLQQQDVANQNFGALVDRAIGLIDKDPTLFGFSGRARQTAQDVTTLAEGVGRVFGVENAETAVADAAKRAAGGDLSPELFSGLFDPNLPKVQSLFNLLVFSGAEALAGQQGRAISDRDVQLFRQIFGDPQSLFTSSKKVKAKLELAKGILSDRQRSVDERIRPGATRRTIRLPSGLEVEVEE